MQAAITASNEKRLLIDPAENIIVGGNLICQYLGVSSFTTLITWHELYGLPIMKRPDGMWMTSISAIDSWIFMASTAELENRGYSRGTNNRSDIALQNAVKRAERNKARNQKGDNTPASRSGPAIVKSNEE